MKPLQQYFHLVLQFVFLNFKSEDEMLRCNHSNKTSLAELPHGALYFLDFTKWNSNFLVHSSACWTLLGGWELKARLIQSLNQWTQALCFPQCLYTVEYIISLTLRLRLLPMIVKCGDDLRQEQLAYQLLLQFQVRFAVYLFWILVDGAVLNFSLGFIALPQW